MLGYGERGISPIEDARSVWEASTQQLNSIRKMFQMMSDDAPGLPVNMAIPGITNESSRTLFEDDGPCGVVVRVLRNHGCTSCRFVSQEVLDFIDKHLEVRGNNPQPPRKKTLDNHFHDWHAYVFGREGGIVEQSTVPALRRFMELCVNEHGETTYDCWEIEQALTSPVTWLLVAVLQKSHVLEHGDRAGYGVLTKGGVELRSFVLSRKVHDLIEIARRRTWDYVACSPDKCTCNEACNNPFWLREPESVEE